MEKVNLSLRQSIKYERLLVEAKIKKCGHKHLFSHIYGPLEKGERDGCMVCDNDVPE